MPQHIENEIRANTPDPQEQLDLVERLRTQGINAIAADLDIPRSTLSSRLAVIREVFREAGLQEYLNS